MKSERATGGLRAVRSGNLEGLSVGVFRTDASGACLYVNRRWSELTGLSLEDARGDGWARALHEEDCQSVVAAWLRTIRDGAAFCMEYRFARPDGKCHWVLGQAYAEQDERGTTTGYLGTITNVSALKAAEEALRREKELNANIVGSSVDGILAFDRDCTYTVWNPAMEHISGMKASETLGRRAFDVFPFLKEIGEDWYFHEALQGRYAVARERRFKVPSTGHEGFFEGHYLPLRNADREVVGGLAIIRDITALKDAQAQLLQAGKLAAMGQLGAGVAHELNQPLTGLQLLIGLIREDETRRVEEFSEELRVIAEQIVRMGKIVDNVRAFARKSEFLPEAIPAAQPLDAALTLMAEQMRLSGVELARVVESDNVYIHADAVQLQQVILNLLSNALHAVEAEHGHRRIEVGMGGTTEVVDFWVEDSGAGVPAEVRDKVFEPFFSTKDPGRGTGLGLALCYGIVKRHSGEIRVENARGGGARFAFSLPRVEPAPPSAAPGAAEPESVRPRACILVVDDEALVRNLVVRCLGQLGYRCDQAPGAREAVELVARGRYDLALVDLKMPGIDGRTLCGQLRERQPELELVVMSGFVPDEEREQLLHLGVRQILPKPFTKAVLASVLSRALMASAAPEA